MNILKPCKYSYYMNNHHDTPFHSIKSKVAIGKLKFYMPKGTKNVAIVKRLPAVSAYNNNEEAGKDEDGMQRKSFLSIEEAGLVEISGLSIHERFLCRLTVCHFFS